MYSADKITIIIIIFIIKYTIIYTKHYWYDHYNDFIIKNRIIYKWYDDNFYDSSYEISYVS